MFWTMLIIGFALLAAGVYLAWSALDDLDCENPGWAVFWGVLFILGSGGAFITAGAAI